MATASLATKSGGRIHYALVAGSCAAMGSFFGKLTSTESTRPLLAGTVFEQLLDTWLLTVVFVALMLISNGMVWTFFVKALHSSGGSLVATVASSTTNFLLSAFLGSIVFGEATTLLWWSGTSLIIVGMVLIGTDTEGKQASTDKKTT